MLSNTGWCAGSLGTARPGHRHSCVAMVSRCRNPVYVTSDSEAQISTSRSHTRFCPSSSQDAQDGLVGNELFSIQDILLISKIIRSLVRVLQGTQYFGVCLPCLEVPAAGFIGFFVSSFVVSSNRACLL